MMKHKLPVFINTLDLVANNILTASDIVTQYDLAFKLGYITKHNVNDLAAYNKGVFKLDKLLAISRYDIFLN